MRPLWGADACPAAAAAAAVVVAAVAAVVAVVAVAAARSMRGLRFEFAHVAAAAHHHRRLLHFSVFFRLDPLVLLPRPAHPAVPPGLSRAWRLDTPLPEPTTAPEKADVVVEHDK